MVSAEPAQRATRVSILNKPTVAAAKRPLGRTEGSGLPSRNPARHFSDVFVRRGGGSVWCVDVEVTRELGRAEHVEKPNVAERGRRGLNKRTL